MVERSSTDTEDTRPDMEVRTLDIMREYARGFSEGRKFEREMRGVAQTPDRWTAQDLAEAKAEAKELHDYFHPAQAAPEPADEIDRLRRALELLTDELPEEMHTLDEPDEDWEVIVKMRAIAREALSPSHRGSPE